MPLNKQKLKLMKFLVKQRKQLIKLRKKSKKLSIFKSISQLKKNNQQMTFLPQYLLRFLFLNLHSHQHQLFKHFFLFAQFQLISSVCFAHTNFLLRVLSFQIRFFNHYYYYYYFLCAYFFTPAINYHGCILSYID
jgi:hypothetical protein